MIPAALFVLAWVAAAIAALRLVPTESTQRSTLLRLHAVIALALALGYVSSTRILGFVWFYLTLWAWTIDLLMIIAIVWTAVAMALAVATLTLADAM